MILGHYFDVFWLCSMFLEYIAMTRSRGGCSATLPFRSSHCYITFRAYSVIIFIEINSQRISFNYPGKMAEQFYKILTK